MRYDSMIKQLKSLQKDVTITIEEIVIYVLKKNQKQSMIIKEQLNNNLIIRYF
jgi:hypothetical protein